MHSHSALGLFLPARAKRGSAETAAGAVRATRTSSRMLKSISSAVSAHPLHKTTATCHKTTATCHKTCATCHKTCVRHAKACSSYQKKHVKYSRANLKGANSSHNPSCPRVLHFFISPQQSSSHSSRERILNSLDIPLIPAKGGSSGYALQNTGTTVPTQTPCGWTQTTIFSKVAGHPSQSNSDQPSNPDQDQAS